MVLTWFSKQWLVKVQGNQKAEGFLLQEEPEPPPINQPAKETANRLMKPRPKPLPKEDPPLNDSKYDISKWDRTDIEKEYEQAKDNNQKKSQGPVKDFNYYYRLWNHEIDAKGKVIPESKRPRHRRVVD